MSASEKQPEKKKAALWPPCMKTKNGDAGYSIQRPRGYESAGRGPEHAPAALHAIYCKNYFLGSQESTSSGYSFMNRLAFS